MKPIAAFVIGMFSIILLNSVNVNCKKVKSSQEDKSEEASKETGSEEETTRTVGEKAKKKITPARNITFMVSARNLGKVPAEINPYVSMFYQTKASDLNAWTSEVISGTSNPSWHKVFWFNWMEGTGQTIKFKVKNQIKKASDQLLGEVELDVDEYIANGENTEIHLNESKNGVIFIDKTIPISFRLSARGLARKDTFHGKSDPYVKCSWRYGPDGSDAKFGKTQVINNVEDADWLDIITFDAYQPGKDQYWHFKVFDKDAFTTDDFLGEAFIKVDPFLENPKMRSKSTDLSLKGKLIVKLI